MQWIVCWRTHVDCSGLICHSTTSQQLIRYMTLFCITSFRVCFHDTGSSSRTRSNTFIPPLVALHLRAQCLRDSGTKVKSFRDPDRVCRGSRCELKLSFQGKILSRIYVAWDQSSFPEWTRLQSFRSILFSAWRLKRMHTLTYNYPGWRPHHFRFHRWIKRGMSPKWIRIDYPVSCKLINSYLRLDYIIYNNPSFSPILIGSLLKDSRTFDARHNYKV